MRLADFIEQHLDEIVDEAEVFARTLAVGEVRLNSAALRDHIPEMLRVMANDLRSAQTAYEAKLKSQGEFPPPEEGSVTPAQTHAGVRADQGFDVIQLLSEYRVLRATVLRLWTSRYKSDEYSITDINRFNEAVDQAIAESVSTFSTQIDEWRNVFLGILGHELRGPLSAILMASEMLGLMEVEPRVAKNVAHIIGAGERMRALLNDLLDFNRVSFGLGLLINRTHVDLAKACAEEVELLKVNWPNHQIECQSSGPTEGSFDESRVREVVWNLVTNAAKYGDAGEPINVYVEGDDDRIRIRVVNGGTAIPEAQVEELFEPLRRASNKDAVDGSLGLGLFVVKQVALAHGGSVDVHCADGLTEFSVMLGRGK